MSKTFLLRGEYLRAARAIARIDQKVLAQASGLSIETIKRLEKVDGDARATNETMEKIIGALREAGVSFSACGVPFKFTPDAQKLSLQVPLDVLQRFLEVMDNIDRVLTGPPVDISAEDRARFTRKSKAFQRLLTARLKAGEWGRA